MSLSIEQYPDVNQVVETLMGGTPVDRSKIHRIFTDSVALADQILHKLHFKIKRNMPDGSINAILEYLHHSYIISNDIRYYNELLWLTNIGKENYTEILKSAQNCFYKNLDERACYIGNDTRFSSIQFEQANQEISARGNQNALRVCLIGLPVFFGKIIKELKKSGFEVDQFHVAHHPNRLIHLLYRQTWLIRILSVLCGNSYAFRSLKLPYNDAQIGVILRAGKYDLGFHKLNFIIRENIFNSFEKGLLNDHWGYLPTLRGKSTIAYSVLLGIPLTATVHLVEKGIDTGSIICYDQVDYASLTTINKIRNKFRRTMPDRIIRAVKLMSSSSFKPIFNQVQSGLTFYEMHPLLINHVENKILTQS